MISFIFQQAVAGLWAEVWRFGLGFGLMILCFAAAYVSPIWKRYFVWAGVVIGIFMFAFTTGVIIGERRVRAQWFVAEQAAIERGNQARSDAERTVRRKPAGRLRNDGDIYNRDRAQGAVRGVARDHLFGR